MSDILTSNTGYNGGSPRIRHENSTIKIVPKESFNWVEYANKIEKNYLLHNLTKQDLVYLIDYFDILISEQKYSGEKNNNKLILNYITIIETLYADGEINVDIIQNIIKRLNYIKDNITPPTIVNKPIKIEGTTNTINNYDGTITNITREKTQTTPIDTSVSILDIDSIIKVINKYYLEDIITKDQIENLNNSFKVLNGDSIELVNLPNFLNKINILVENAYTDGRIPQDRLLVLINKMNIILNSPKPEKIIPKKVIKNKISNLAPGYKK